MRTTLKAGGALPRALGLIALALGLSSCATRGPVVYDYGNFKTVVYDFGHYKVIKAPRAMVQEECFRPGNTFDDGRPQNRRRTRACWKRDAREMWVSAESPEDILHELCHLEGLHKESCHEYRWDLDGSARGVPAARSVRREQPPSSALLFGE